MSKLSRTKLGRALIALAEQHGLVTSSNGREVYAKVDLKPIKAANLRHSAPMVCFVCGDDTRRVDAYWLCLRPMGSRDHERRRVAYLCRHHVEE